MIARTALRCAIMATVIMVVAADVLAAGNYAFAPPRDWPKLRTGSTSAWVDSSGYQTVRLFPTQFAGDLSAFVNRTLARERSSHPTLHLWTNRTYPLCGGHPGRYLIWTTKSAQSNTWEQMLALWGYDAYIVSYKRPGNAPPNDVARLSLLSICGVGSIPLAPGGVPIAPQPAVPAQRQQAGTLPDTGAEPAPEPTGTIAHPYMPVIPP